jgi:hypothetical protein
MKKHKEVKWSEVARRSMWDHAKKLELMDKILSDSKMSKEGVEELDKKIKKGIAKKHGLI